MKILLIGSGGREAALAWKISNSKLVTEVIVAPGNPGMKRISTKIKFHQSSDWESYVELRPDLVVIGPEIHLSEGLVNFLESKEIKVVGPTKEAAMLESSKVFCKEVLVASHIPTAEYKVATNLDEAREHLKNWKREGAVVKVDGLAQGKGVIVCQNLEESLNACEKFFSGEYLGFKANKLVIEEKLSGPEVSCFALCDGENFIFLGSATDYKRLHNNDLGPNTGGMGTISPSPLLSSEDEVWISEKVFAPALQTMKEKNIPFKGFLFAGLMKTPTGYSVLEFNTRLGDPETQSLLPRMKDDLIPYLFAAAEGKLHLHVKPKLEGSAVHVVIAADGYPGVEGKPIKQGDEIHFFDLSPDVIFFSAGITEKGGKYFTKGGRICGLTAMSRDLLTAREKVYSEIIKVYFNGAHYRRDTGARFI